MRRHIKGIISLLLCAAIVASVGVSALAALEVSSAPEDTGDGTTILDEAAISEKVNALIKQYTDASLVDSSKLAIAYTYLATGNSWYYNPDMWFYSASIYKVPLMMIMAEKESKGEISQDTDIMGLPLSQVEKIVLVDSNNDYAHNTMRYLTGETVKKSFEKGTRPMYQAYSSLPESYYHSDFVEYSYFTARFMNDVMCTLYNDQSRFPNIIGLLKTAQPQNYYHLKLGDTYQIAQKYGYYKDSRNTEWHNNTGIIYTPNPIVLTVMTADAKKGEQFMGDLAELFVNYTLELDTKLSEYKAEQERAEQERIAAEQAAAEAEAKAKAEEEARIAKEEADKKAAEEAALRAAEKEEKAAARKAVISKILRYVGIAGAVIVAVLIAAAVVTSMRKRRELEEMPAPRRRGRRGYDDYGDYEDEDDYDEDEDDYYDEDDYDEDEDDDEDDYTPPARRAVSAKPAGKAADAKRSGKAPSPFAGILHRDASPARGMSGRGYADYDDEDDEDDEDDDVVLYSPRKSAGASVSAVRRRAFAADTAADDDGGAPRKVRGMKERRNTVSAGRLAAYDDPDDYEDEDEEDEEDGYVPPVHTASRNRRTAAPRRAASYYDDEDEDADEDDEDGYVPPVRRAPLTQSAKSSSPARRSFRSVGDDEDEDDELSSMFGRGGRSGRSGGYSPRH